MNLNKHNIFLIVVFSIAIGLIYNFINPKGIPLFKKERILKWEEQIIESIPSDTISSSVESQVNIKKETVREESSSIVKNEVKVENKILPPFNEPIAITLEQAYKLYNQKIKFIDARTKEEFATGHIKGAINIPFYKSDQYENVLVKIPKNETIITYCSSAECDISILLADELFEKGYKRIYMFHGGWEEWSDANYPMGKIK